MTQSHATTEKRSRSRPIAALVVVVVLVLYPLSIGPAHLMAWKGLIRWRTFEAAYWPLKQVYDQLPPIRRPLNWHQDRWSVGSFHIERFHSGFAPSWFDPFQDDD